MEETKPLIRMQIDATGIINRIASKYAVSLPHQIVRMGYDAEFDWSFSPFKRQDSYFR